MVMRPLEPGERRVEPAGEPPFTVVRRPEPDIAPIVGGASDNHYRAGTVVFTHLNWDPESGFYRTSWWNAVQLMEGE